jgi:hypothetical protein
MNSSRDEVCVSVPLFAERHRCSFPRSSVDDHKIHLVRMGIEFEMKVHYNVNPPIATPAPTASSSSMFKSGKKSRF